MTGMLLDMGLIGLFFYAGAAATVSILIGGLILLKKSLTMIRQELEKEESGAETARKAPDRDTERPAE